MINTTEWSQKRKTLFQDYFLKYTFFRLPAADDKACVLAWCCGGTALVHRGLNQWQGSVRQKRQNLGRQWLAGFPWQEWLQRSWGRYAENGNKSLICLANIWISFASIFAKQVVYIHQEEGYGGRTENGKQLGSSNSESPEKSAMAECWQKRGELTLPISGESQLFMYVC